MLNFLNLCRKGITHFSLREANNEYSQNIRVANKQYSWTITHLPSATHTKSSKRKRLQLQRCFSIISKMLLYNLREATIIEGRYSSC